MTCSTSAGLSIGQFITVAGIPVQITGFDATSPSAVFVQVTANVSGIGTGQTASYTAPVLGPEIQLPTKSAAAPTSLAWLQGDMEQDSGAALGGPCAFVNTTAGTPGTWSTLYCPAMGTATLVSGAAVVSTAAACTPSSTCNIQLTRCGNNASTAVGYPTVTASTPGTSFTITSLTAANATATGDLGTVCWRIN